MPIVGAETRDSETGPRPASANSAAKDWQQDTVVPMRRASRADVLSHIRDMSAELAQMSRGVGCTVLASLLKVAEEEALRCQAQGQ